MTQLASISVDNSSVRHNSMFIVISVHPTDRDCCDSANCSEANFHRIKNLTIDIQPGYDHAKINLNFAITLSVFLAAYLFICPFLCFVEPYSEKNFKCLIDEHKCNSVVSLSTAITPVSNNRSYYSLKEKRNHSNNRIADKHLTADLIENKQENNTANNNDANGNKNDEIIHIQQIDFDIGNSSDLV